MFYRKTLNRPLTAEEVDSNFLELEEKVNAVFGEGVIVEETSTKSWTNSNFIKKADLEGKTFINVQGINESLFYKKDEVDTMIAKLLRELAKQNINIDMES